MVNSSIIPGFNNPFVQLAVAIPPLIIGFYHFGLSAFYSLKDRNPNMDVLVSVGSLSAVVYSLFLIYTHDHSHVYVETAVTIITLVLLGSNLEAAALSKTSIQMGLAASSIPLEVKVSTKDTEGNDIIITQKSNQLKTGDVMLVAEGDKVAADGMLIFGQLEVGQAAITGESLPVHKIVGDQIFAGSIVTSGNARIQITQTGTRTLVGQMSQWIKSAQSQKPHIQKLGDTISGIFVQVVVGLAIVTFLVNHYGFNVDVQDSVMRAIAVLVVSCPCAMGLATPTAVSVGLGLAARNGILVKGGQALEKFANIKHMAYDKTGTITTGDFMVHTFTTTHDAITLKNIVYQLECYSSHPIARSIVKNHKDWNTKDINWIRIEEIKGFGMQAIDDQNQQYKLGSKRWLDHQTSSDTDDLYLWQNGKLIASISIKDELHHGLSEVLHYFDQHHIQQYLISGDHDYKVQQSAVGLPFKQVYAEVLPEEKMSYLEKWRSTGLTAMTGDGMNDAPALAAADIAIVMGHGSDLSKQQADFILPGSGISSIKKAHEISAITLRGIKQNLFWAFSYNLIAIPVASIGLLNPTWAALFMAMSDVVVIGNALRMRWIYRGS
jgi:P-type Cu+ transporter